MSEFVTIEEAAELAGESTRDIRKAIDAGTLPAARFELRAVSKKKAREFWRDSGGGAIDWPTSEHWTLDDLADAWGVSAALLKCDQMSQGTLLPGVRDSLIGERVKVVRITKADAVAYAERERWLGIGEAADYLDADQERVRLAALTGLIRWRREGSSPEFAKSTLDAYAGQDKPAPDTSALVAVTSTRRNTKDSLGLAQRGAYPWFDTREHVERCDHIIPLEKIDQVLAANRHLAAPYYEKLPIHNVVGSGAMRDIGTAERVELLTKWREQVELPDFKPAGALDKVKEAFTKAS